MAFARTQPIQNSKTLWTFLFVLLLSLLTYNSNGVIRGGGDDDEGSGLGGTGKTLRNLAEPGAGSGLGGTGFRPYLGIITTDSNEPAELVVVDRPQYPAVFNSDAATNLPTAIAASRADTQLADSRVVSELTAPIASPVQVADTGLITRDSSAISIAESIQWDVDTQVLELQSAHSLLAENGRLNGNSFESQQSEAGALSGKSREQELANLALAPAINAADSLPEETIEPDQTPVPVSWASLVEQMEQQPEWDSNALSDITDIVNSEEVTAESMQRPERIQRPALPPVQSVRPIQRAGLLPPRVRPLKL